MAKTIVGWAGPAGYLLAVPATLAVSWATYRWLEEPCMAAGSRLARAITRPAAGQPRMAPVPD